MPTIKRGKKVQTIIQKKSKFIDLRRIAKNNVDVLNRVLMTDDFKGYNESFYHLSHNHSAKQYANEFIHVNITT